MSRAPIAMTNARPTALLLFMVFVFGAIPFIDATIVQYVVLAALATCTTLFASLLSSYAPKASTSPRPAAEPAG